MVYPKDIRNNAFLCWCWKKVHYHREDLIIGISGPTGFGKTTLAVRLAELLDRDVNGLSRFEPYSVIDGKKVLVPRLVNSIDAYKELRKKINWPVGTAFCIDEAQSLLNSRDFMTRKNKDVIRLISTGRVFRSYTFIILPHWEHLDNQIKSYLHAVVIVHRPDKKKNLSFWSPYLIRPMGYGKPPLTVKFRRRDNNTGRLYAISGCYTMRPTKELDIAQQEKTNSWKMLVHQGLIGSSGGLLKDEPIKITRKQLTKEEKENKVKELLDKIKPIKEKFRKGTKYSISQIRAWSGEQREICEAVAFRLLEQFS